MLTTPRVRPRSSDHASLTIFVTRPIGTATGAAKENSSPHQDSEFVMNRFFGA